MRRCVAGYPAVNRGANIASRGSVVNDTLGVGVVVLRTGQQWHLRFGTGIGVVAPDDSF
jgi:hypothetical protein